MVAHGQLSSAKICSLSKENGIFYLLIVSFAEFSALTDFSTHQDLLLSN